MSFLQKLRNRVFSPLFGTPRDGGTLGIYGAPNAGKTLLANRICHDCLTEGVGTSSETPHETRVVRERRGLTIENGDYRLRIDLRDTPGLASSVPTSLFTAGGLMDTPAARRRAREATQGILAAIDNLRSVDGILLVVDATTDPNHDANRRLIAHVEARRVPVLVVANKIDLPHARPERVAEGCRPHPVVPVSALTGKGTPALYDRMLEIFA